MEQVKKVPSFQYALFVTIVAFAIIMIPAVFFGAKTQPLFLLSWMVSFPLCMRLDYTYNILREAINDE